MFACVADVRAAGTWSLALTVCPHGVLSCPQEVMIGYSDSGKDAGRLAAAWGLYEVQVRSHLLLASRECHSLTLLPGSIPTSFSPLKERQAAYSCLAA